MKRMLLLLALLWAGPVLPAAAADLEHAYPIGGDVRIDIETISGKIEIEGWNREEVRVEADGDGSDAVEIDHGSDWLTIRAPRASGFFRGKVDVDLKLQVPEGSRVRASTVNGEIKIEGVHGDVDARTANGKIQVEGALREVKLEAVNSAIELRGRVGRVDARTMSGSIEIEGVTEEVSATTMSGKIEVEGPGPLRRVDLRTLSGSIELEAALAPGVRAHLKTYSGSVELSLPHDTSARFDVQTLSGSIDHDFTGPSRVSGGPGRRLDLEVGGGDGRVTIETLSGSVDIEATD